MKVDEKLVGVEPLNYQVFEVDAMGLSADSVSASTTVNTNASSLSRSTTSSSSSSNLTENRMLSSSSDTWSQLVSNLETGVEYYVRVSAQGDGVGYGQSGEAQDNPVVPRGEPGQVGSVVISRVDADTLRVEIGQNADTNGAAVDGYNIEWDTSPLFTGAQRGQLSLAPDFHVQAVRLNAWQRGWSADSEFSLSLFDFGGAYSARLGGDDTDGLPTFVSISEGMNSLNRTTPNVTAGFGSASLYKAVPRGGFVSVGGQEFRVCLDDSFPYSSKTLTLCSVSDPYVPAYFTGAATKYDNTLTRVAAYVLDTAIGSAFKLAVGDTALRTFNGPDTNISVNDLTSVLARGDHLRLGHPEDGRVFTVCKDDGTSDRGFNSKSLPLCASNDPDSAVSVLDGDIISATYEVQTFGLWLNTSAVTYNVSEVFGFRLMFGDETSAASEAGGDPGCLSFYSTAAEVSDCCAVFLGSYQFLSRMPQRVPGGSGPRHRINFLVLQFDIYYR